MLWYSPGVRPCEAMTAGVISGSCMARDFMTAHTITVMRTLLAILVFAFPLLAGQEHTHQHDPVNVGKAHLETSCRPEAQKEIDRGLAMLHSFWYAEAEKAFRGAAAADAECGMAWWGVAMANFHPIWAPATPAELKTGTEAVANAQKAGAKTDRESAYIAAIQTFYSDAGRLDHLSRMHAYEQAMAALERDHPKDREAAIFHALVLVGIGINTPKDKTYAYQKRGAEILNRRS